MARIATSAGKFKLETYSDGYPHWVEFVMDGNQVVTHAGNGKIVTNLGIQPDDLKDLIFAAQRLLEKIESART